MSAEPQVSFVFPSILDLRAAHRELLKQQQHGAVDSRVVEDFVDRARMTGAKLYRDSDRELAQSVIDYWIAALYRSRVDLKEATLEPFDDAQARTLTEQSPYLGLAPFSEADSSRYFGRTALIGALRSRIESERVLILIGQSGTGKSSLVSGGIVPRLRKGGAAASDTWRYFEAIVPGSEPLVSLARLLRPKDTVLPDGWLAREARKLLASPQRLHEALTASGSEPVLVVVDQFEELFTLCSDVRQRRAFAANLAYLATAPGPSHRVVITVRSDYERNVAKLEELEPFLRTSQVRIGSLNESELREVIERPAEMAGLMFEPGLVDKIVDDVRGEPAALPLLQFTLWKLWEERDERNRLTWAEYDRLHGALFALGTVANEVFGTLAPQAQNCARRIFLRIVRTSAAPDAAGGDRVAFEIMSRRVRKSDVIAGEVREEAEAVLEKLFTAGLLRATQGETPADVQIEVAHEALIRNWGLLRSWIDQEPLLIRKRDQLEGMAQEWIESGHSAAFLDRVQLDDAQAWLLDAEARAFVVSESVVQYVRASHEELERAEKVERQGKRLIRTLIGVSVVVAFAALAAAFLLERATRQREIAVARQQAALAKQNELDLQRRVVAAQFQNFKMQSPDERVRELQGRIRTLEAQNAELRRVLDTPQSLPPTTTVDAPRGEDPALGEARARLQKLERELRDVRAELVRQQAAVVTVAELNQRYTGEINRLRGALAAVPPPPPTYELLTGEKLRSPDLVSSTHKDAVPASIGCFFKDRHGSHYLLTTASALKGEKGDLVVRRSGGVPRRIGVIWWQDPGLDAAVALVLQPVETEEKLPPLRDGMSAKGVRGKTLFDTPGDAVKVVSSRGVFDAKLTTVTGSRIGLAYRGDSLDRGAPVLNGVHSLVGIISSAGPEGAAIIPIRRVLDLTKLSLDVDD